MTEYLGVRSVSVKDQTSRFVWASLGVCMLTAACGEGTLTDHRPDGSIGQIRMALTLSTATDVESVRFGLERVPCNSAETPPSFSHGLEAEVQSGTLPSSVGANHRFVDETFAINPGCYDISALPLNGQGQPSYDCRGATRRGMRVFSARTTEALLISQCQGQATGLLSALLAFNQPPQIVDVDYSPSKYVPVSEQGATICVTAQDPNGDLLDFSWEAPADLGITPQPAVATADGVRGCALVNTNISGDFDLQVKVYDLFSTQDQPLQRVEEILAAGGQSDLSHVMQTLPLHVAALTSFGPNHADGDELRDQLPILDCNALLRGQNDLEQVIAAGPERLVDLAESWSQREDISAVVFLDYTWYLWNNQYELAWEMGQAVDQFCAGITAFLPTLKKKKKPNDFAKVYVEYVYNGQTYVHTHTLGTKVSLQRLIDYLQNFKGRARIKRLKIITHGVAGNSEDLIEGVLTIHSSGSSYTWTNAGKTRNTNGRVENRNTSRLYADLGGHDVDVTDLFRDVLTADADVQIQSCSSAVGARGSGGSFVLKWSRLFTGMSVEGAQGPIRYIPFVYIPVYADWVTMQNGVVIR